MSVTVDQLLNSLAQFEVRDEDVQCVGVYTGSRDIGTPRETTTRYFHVQLTGRKAIPPLIRWSKWPPGYSNARIGFATLHSPNYWWPIVKRWVDNYYLFDRVGRPRRPQPPQAHRPSTNNLQDVRQFRPYPQFPPQNTRQAQETSW